MSSPRLASLVLLLASGCFSPSGSAATESETQTTGAPGSTTSTSPGTTSTSEPTAPTSTTATTEETTEPVVTSTSTSTGEPDTTSPATTAVEGCGDSVQGPGEECDDGNMVEGDGCSNACKLEYCGDMIVQPKEECDGGDGCEMCVRTYFRVFVTANPISLVEFKNLDSADMICTARARGAGLTGQYVAWLSSSGQTAADRLVHGTRPWQLLNGTPIAKNWDELIDGELAAAIDVDEYGNTVPVLTPICGACPVWTATTITGTALANNCNGWSGQPLGPAAVGECSLADARWTESCEDLTCDGLARLYCFEQPKAP
ncbi:DUF4215 domain-containing protein [Nannocystis sp. ILAH1]|uniref:DUF4215 domain-containing protein n=1 Tax=unclassified Nannocystis TaxID=2627009 RepID=UPI002270EC3D|nr:MULTISPECIES: DUF4215 domain-containing protein [unclassified Nannocystis]MCY0994995.1 DUF4215 domain-containing protein [Nannocystis sp. ILAH1]MCY1069671.1 DUF4215 domain-containing protein [Nannocystis sp. RBIL2]